MKEIIEFLFSDFLTWLGGLIYLAVIIFGLAAILEALASITQPVRCPYAGSGEKSEPSKKKKDEGS